jgi:ankyrin repeat protein
VSLCAAANPDKLDDKGLTAIERAARYGKADVCRRLMAHGADIFSRDERGQTVLLRAASWGNVDVVKALIEEGKADHRDRDMVRNASRFNAPSRASPSSRLLTPLCFVADACLRQMGNTPLLRAAYSGSLEVFEYLVSMYALR